MREERNKGGQTDLNESKRGYLWTRDHKNREKKTREERKGRKHEEKERVGEKEEKKRKGKRKKKKGKREILPISWGDTPSICRKRGGSISRGWVFSLRLLSLQDGSISAGEVFIADSGYICRMTDASRVKVREWGNEQGCLRSLRFTVYDGANHTREGRERRSHEQPQQTSLPPSHTLSLPHSFILSPSL